MRGHGLYSVSVRGASRLDYECVALSMHSLAAAVCGWVYNAEFIGDYDSLSAGQHAGGGELLCCDLF